MSNASGVSPDRLKAIHWCAYIAAILSFLNTWLLVALLAK